MVVVCLCFGGGDGDGSIYSGTGSAHNDLCGDGGGGVCGGDGVGSMYAGSGSAHSDDLSQPRRKSALLCLAGLESVYGVS